MTTLLINPNLFEFEPKILSQYCHLAVISSVHDGATVVCEIDLGFEIKILQTVTLHKVNISLCTPEEAMDYKNKLTKLLLNKTVLLYTIKNPDKSSKNYLGIIYNKHGKIINKCMIDHIKG